MNELEDIVDWPPLPFILEDSQNGMDKKECLGTDWDVLVKQSPAPSQDPIAIDRELLNNPWIAIHGSLDPKDRSFIEPRSNNRSV